MFLSKSLKDIHNNKQLYKSDSASNISKKTNKNFHYSVSPAMSLLKSKQKIDDGRSEAIKKNCNKSFDNNGIFFFYFSKKFRIPHTRN